MRRRARQTPFGPSEDLPPLGTAVAVLSDAYWERQFGRARDVLGRTIDLNFKPFLIIGVMPREFSGARWPGNRASTPDVWVPIWCHPLLEPGSKLLTGRTMWWGLQPIGRLLDGVEVPQARAQIKAVAAALDLDYPGQRHARAPWVWGVTDFDARVLRGQEAAMLGLAGAATLLVMLIACGNVAGCSGTGAARRQESTIRLSLGASRMPNRSSVPPPKGLALSVAGTVLGFIVGMADGGGAGDGAHRRRRPILACGVSRRRPPPAQD